MADKCLLAVLSLPTCESVTSILHSHSATLRLLYLSSAALLVSVISYIVFLLGVQLGE